MNQKENIRKNKYEEDANIRKILNQIERIKKQNMRKILSQKSENCENIVHGIFSQNMSVFTKVYHPI